MLFTRALIVAAFGTPEVLIISIQVTCAKKPAVENSLHNHDRGNAEERYALQVQSIN